MSCACLHDVDCTLAMQNVALEDENARLRAVLADVRDECDDRMDTEDDDEGRARPNVWMYPHGRVASVSEGGCLAAEVVASGPAVRRFFDEIRTAVWCPWPVYPSPFDWPA